MNALLREDILKQPDAILTTMQDVRKQMEILDRKLLSNCSQVFFTGSGDSYFAIISLKYAALLNTNKTIHTIHSQEAAYYQKYSNQDLLIAISITGESQRTIEAVKNALMQGAKIISITANKDSTLARLSDDIIVIPVISSTRKTPHSLDYTVTLTVIALLIESLAGKNLLDNNLSVAKMNSVINEVKANVESLEKTLADSERFFFLGAGPSYGTAQYAASKLWEARGITSYAFELEEVAHGPFMLFQPGDTIFIFGPSGKSIHRAQFVSRGLKSLNASTTVITDQPELFKHTKTLVIPNAAEEWSPFMTCLPAQWLCYFIAETKGIDVTAGGRFYSPEAYKKAFEYLRGIEPEKLYK